MNDRQKFDFFSAKGILKQTPEERIETRVNMLIAALYIPEHGYDGMTKVDPHRIERFEIDDSEPINWGDLKCLEVEKSNHEEERWIITIDEAAPDVCDTFCDYISYYMKSYGWNVTVKTEW